MNFLSHFKIRFFCTTIFLILLTGCNIPEPSSSLPTNEPLNTSSPKVESGKQTSLPVISATVSANESPSQTEKPLTLFQTISAYNSDWQYTIQFDERNWEIEENINPSFPDWYALRHKHLPCQLRLSAGGMGRTKSAVKVIGGHNWILTSGVPHVIGYVQEDLSPEYYILEIWFADSPENVPSLEKREACQREAEEVLATFTPLPTPPIGELTPSLFENQQLSGMRWRLFAFFVDDQPLDYSLIEPVYIFFHPDNSLTVITSDSNTDKFSVTAFSDYSFQVGEQQDVYECCNEAKEAQHDKLLEQISLLTKYEVKDGMILLSGENSRAMLTLK